MKRIFMKTLIVTGGTVDYSFAVSYRKEHNFDYCIAADSGIRFFVQSGIQPDEVLGDFDSADPAQLSQLRSNSKIIFHQYRPEKDAVDTELALRLALEKAAVRSIFWAAQAQGLTICLAPCGCLALQWTKEYRAF